MSQESSLPTPVSSESSIRSAFLGSLSTLKETHCKAPWQSQEELTYPGIIWAAIFGIDVVDPDGWRRQSRNFQESPITYDQFYRFVQESTVYLSNRCTNLPLPKSISNELLEDLLKKKRAIEKDLSLRLAEAETTIDCLKKEVDSHEKDIQGEKHDRIVCDSALTDLQSRYASLRSLLDDTEKELTNQRHRNSLLQQEKETETAFMQMAENNLKLCREQKNQLISEVESWKAEYKIEEENVAALQKKIDEMHDLLQHTRKQEQFWMERYIALVDRMGLQTPPASATAPTPPKDCKDPQDANFLNRSHDERTVLEDMATYMYDHAKNDIDATLQYDSLSEEACTLAAEQAVKRALAIITECRRCTK